MDNAGNRTAKTDKQTNVTSNYTYDSIYQLLTAAQGGSNTESYSYDPVGNRTASLGVSSYTTNSSNELTAMTGASFTYDYNGNTTSKTVSSNTTSYAWDYENRLTTVTLPGTSGTVSFVYDPFGRRIKKVSSAGTSIFAYDGDNLIEETNSSGTVVARYSQGLNIDEPLAMLRSGTTSFYHTDGLRSVNSLSSSAGSIVQAYGYDPFGKQTSSSGSIANPFQYTARESDAETGLQYNRARYYDSNAGRFLSEDPVRFDGGQNFYRYVRNNPVLLIDPTGLITLLPPDPTINTVACNGKGGMKIQIGIPRSSPLQEKCTEDCIKVHEGSHLADDMKANPKICKGKANGVLVGFSNPDEQRIGEIKAYTAELQCLNDKKQHFCKDCFQPLMDAIQNAGDRINAFKNGTN